MVLDEIHLLGTYNKQSYGHPLEVSFWSKLTLKWLTPYIKGASDGKLMYPSSFPKILEEDSTLKWADLLEEEIIKEYNRNYPHKKEFKVHLFQALFNIMKVPLFIIFLVKLLLEFLGIKVAVLLQRSLEVIEVTYSGNLKGSKYNSNVNYGIILAIMIICLQFLMILLSTQLGFFICRQTIRLQGSITHVLYRSILASGRVYASNYNWHNNKYIDEDIPNIYNYILIDMNCTTRLMVSIVDILIIPCRLCLVCFSLKKAMGSSLISNKIMLSITLLACSVMVSELCRAFLKQRYLLSRDTRLSLLNDIMNSISSIKLLGWEIIAYWLINKARIIEIWIRSAYIPFQSFSSVIYSITNIITQYTLLRTALIVSLTYSLDFSPSVIIPTYYLLDMASQRLSDLPVIIATIIEGMNSAYRIELIYKKILYSSTCVNKLNREVFYDKCTTRDLIQDIPVFLRDIKIQIQIPNQDINIKKFTVERGSVSLIEDCYPTSSSIFVQVILGYHNYEALNNNSLVMLKHLENNTSVLWCPSEPWIPCGTIKSIITFGSPFCKTIYEKVLSICELNTDIEDWIEKDGRFIDNRQSLSGGQAARLGLARVIYKFCFDNEYHYNNSQLIILENTLQSVDLSVSLKILYRLFIDKDAVFNGASVILILTQDLIGYFNRMVLNSSQEINKTKITSIKHYVFTEFGIIEDPTIYCRKLSNLNSISEYNYNSGNSVDKFFFRYGSLDESIMSNDTFPLLEKMNEYGSVSSSTYKRYFDGVNKPMLFIIVLGVFLLVLGTLIVQFGLAYTLEIISMYSDDNGNSFNTTNPTLIQGNAPMTVISYRVSSTIDSRNYKGFKAINLIFRYVQNWFGYKIHGGNFLISLESILNYSRYIIGFIFIGYFTILTLESILCIQASQTIHNNLLYSIIINSSLPTICGIPLGQIINKLSTDLIITDWHTMRSIGRVLWGLTSFLLNFIFLAILAPWAIPIFALILILIAKFVIIPIIFAARNIQRTNFVALSPICSIMASTWVGAKTIAIFKNQNYFENVTLGMLEYIQRIRFIQHSSQIWCNVRIQLLILPITLFNFIFPYFAPTLLSFVREYKWKSSPTFFQYIDILSNPLIISWGIARCLSLAESATSLLMDYVQMEREMCSVERLLQLDLQISREDNLRGYIYAKNNDLEKAHLNKLGVFTKKEQLNINNSEVKRYEDPTYRFCYPLLLNQISSSSIVLSLLDVSITYMIPRELNKTTYIVENCNMYVGVGQIVGIVGRTGSGKSSLFSSIINITPICNGLIKLNGISIHSIPRYILRSKIGVIPQSVYLMPNSTIRDIIDPYYEYEDEKIYEVLRICCLDKLLINDSLSIDFKVTLYQTSDNEMTKFMGFSSDDQILTISDTLLQYLHLCHILLYSKRYSLILIDEVADHLSQESEHLNMRKGFDILDIILNYCSHCGIIVISHDLHVMKKCNQLYELEESRLKIRSYDDIVRKLN
ncbi:ABC transporter family protein [Cryptosporidium andersoni]|uniref:ABC transporter family protein n=1 Tax=Cryptosporidium andersoni TaxID=117008 RepID=A0A1J4MVY8_9CRYT|nr:ABC transporter family protein [Cryptosporidium andersoni]